MPINTLYDDLQANEDYQNSFSNFITSVSNNIQNFLNSSAILIPSDISNFWQSYILNNNFALLEQYLYFKVYAYDTNTLLNMWNNLAYKISTRIFFKLSKTISTYVSANYLLLAQLSNYSNYGITSLSTNQTNNLSSDSTNDTTGDLTINSTVTSMNNTTLPASNVNITVNDINSTQSNNQYTNYNGYEIVEAIDKIQNDIELFLEDILKDIFKQYEAPFYSPLQAKKGVGF